jgi:tRNA A37 threonylcarbamoyladenosine modification protein TsaB
MAWLFIDTHENGRVRYAWLEAGRVLKRVEREGRASLLMPLIAKDLGTPSDSPLKRGRELAGVCVVEGPGSFSAVRGGVLDANLLARFLRVSLVAVSAGDAQDLEGLAARLASGDVSTSTYVAPVYDREPNITMPKKT